MNTYEKQQAFVDAIEDVSDTKVGQVRLWNFISSTNIEFNYEQLYLGAYSPELTKKEIVDKMLVIKSDAKKGNLPNIAERISKKLNLPFKPNSHVYLGEHYQITFQKYINTVTSETEMVECFIKEGYEPQLARNIVASVNTKLKRPLTDKVTELREQFFKKHYNKTMTKKEMITIFGTNFDYTPSSLFSTVTRISKDLGLDFVKGIKKPKPRVITPIHTPIGDFNNMSQAWKALGFKSGSQLRTLLRNDPTEYYIIKE